MAAVVAAAVVEVVAVCCRTRRFAAVVVGSSVAIVEAPGSPSRCLGVRSMGRKHDEASARHSREGHPCRPLVADRKESCRGERSHAEGKACPCATVQDTHQAALHGSKVDIRHVAEECAWDWEVPSPGAEGSMVVSRKAHGSHECSQASSWVLLSPLGCCSARERSTLGTCPSRVGYVGVADRSKAERGQMQLAMIARSS